MNNLIVIFLISIFSLSPFKKQPTIGFGGYYIGQKVSSQIEYKNIHISGLVYTMKFRYDDKKKITKILVYPGVFGSDKSRIIDVNEFYKFKNATSKYLGVVFQYSEEYPGCPPGEGMYVAPTLKEKDIIVDVSMRFYSHKLCESCLFYLVLKKI